MEAITFSCTKFGQIDSSREWAPVEACQTSDHFSTCPNQLCQGKVKKELLGPEPKSVQQQGKISHCLQNILLQIFGYKW